MHNRRCVWQGASFASIWAVGHNGGAQHVTPWQPAQNVLTVSIRDKAITALRWRVSAQVGSQVIIGLSGLLMIRLLLPGDFGLMAAATLLVSLARLTSEMGLGAALVQRPSVETPLLRQIFGAILLWNILLVAMLFVAAPHAARWFAFPELTAVIRVLALKLVIDLFATVPAGLLARRIDFRDLSVIDLWAAAAAAVTGITAAVLGMGVWSLVITGLTTSVVRTAGVLRVMGHTGLPSFDLRGLLPDLRFGAQVTASTVINFVNRKVDIFIVGKALGQEMLGAFAVVVDLAKFPTRTIMPAITRVMFPVYARLQEDQRAAKSAFLQSAEILALILVPAFWGLSAVAGDAVLLLFGDAWAVAAVVLQGLCVAMPIRTIERMLPAVTRGFGREDLTIWNSLKGLSLCIR